MIEEINEPIKVVAAFDKGKITPLLFSWKNRRYNDLITVSSWNDNIGNETLMYFSIMVKTDQSNVYEIYFGTRFFKWYLSKISH